jgi:hypothetical protein
VATNDLTDPKAPAARRPDELTMSEQNIEVINQLLADGDMVVASTEVTVGNEGLRRRRFRAA